MKGSAAKLWIASVGIAIGSVALASHAHADTPGLTCEHRGMEHIERHGGKVEDDAYHRLHHERVTCDGKDEPHGDFAPYERHEPELHANEHHDDKDKKHDDDVPLPGHRDKPGYGCYLTRCG